MKKDNHKTDVIFRQFIIGCEVIAFFPKIKNGAKFCLSYMHIGQHSDADYKGLLTITKPCTDYKNLYNELTQNGYNLQIRKRYV